MNLRQLECFVAVVDEGSFTRAARAIGIAQPSLSQHIRALEEDLDGRLIERLPRGIALTPAGRALLPEFRHRSLLEDAVEQGIADFAIGPLPVRAWDGPLAVIAWEEFVVVVPPTDPLAGRRSVRLEELADREWVLYHQDHGLAGILEETCRRAGFSPRGSVRTSQAEGAARLASAGLGPALVPDNIVLPGIEGSVLRLQPRLIRDVAAYARTE